MDRQFKLLSERGEVKKEGKRGRGKKRCGEKEGKEAQKEKGDGDREAEGERRSRKYRRKRVREKESSYSQFVCLFILWNFHGSSR